MNGRWLDLSLEGISFQRQAQITRVAKSAALSLLTIVTVLTLIPDTMGGDIERLGIDDKTGHVLAYVSVMFCAAFAVGSPLARLQAMGALFVYGGLLEGLQALLGFGRQASWEDMVANTLGLIIGVSAAWLAAWATRTYLARSPAENN